MNILTKLEREIERALDKLAKLDPNSDEYSDLARDIEDMVARYTELKKTNDEDESKSKDRKSEQIHRYIGYGIAIFGIVAPLVVKLQGVKWAFLFEEHGTIASPPGRASFNDIFKK